MTYSARRTNSNTVMLALGWGTFIGAGIVAMYFLGHALYLNERGRAVHSLDGEQLPEPSVPEASN
ncbi:hypothetical protein AB0E70_37450 [Streptomyces murinus]|uniref:hypothetical protein n=1 Tax=Streptomyces murinus TaxID=33900 RepID=UPI000A3A98B1|nr:hypothetical protein [Streptomyces murinus]